MPRQFHPRKRGAHRVACIALYRALLSQCSQIEVPLPFAHARIHPLASIIRKQFRRNAGIESPTLVVTALKMGYEAEELLHAATTGSEAAKSKILALIAEVQAQGTAAREAAAALNPPPLPPPPRRQKPAAYPGAPDTISVRPRPSAEVKSDVRKLPVLIGANGFPFIRVKKPQPEYLNRVLRDKIERKSVRHERIIEWSGEQMDLAIAEQEWDERLGLSQHGEGNWQKVLVQEAQRVGTQMQNESVKTGELGRRMTEVVDREREVWEQERMAEKREKERVRRREWRRKRREEKEAAEGLKDQLSG